MKTYTYPLLARFIYQYANIPITLMLFGYLVVAINGIRYSWINALPAVINLILIYIINRFYFRAYKIFPYRIEVDETGMTCSDFPFSNKKVQIKYENIDEISGGIFSGMYTKPINIFDSKNNVKVAFSTHLKESNELLTIILSKIRKDVYKQAMDKVLELGEKYKEKQKARNKK